MTSTQEEPFVGRIRESALLTSAVDDATAGNGRIVLISGAPGIGKTQLVRRAALTASQNGADAHWGLCTEHSGAPPLWPWTQMVRSALRSAPGTAADRVDELFPDIVSVVPELLPTISESARDLRQLPAESEFRLFESVARYFASAAADKPMVLVLEDVHWADQLSLNLLAHFATSIDSQPILVIATYREVELSRTHPLADTLAHLHRLGVARLPIQALAPDETATLLSAFSGTDAAHDAASTIHDRTGGNPLFVAEIARSIAEGTLDPREDRVPEGIREAIGRRLNQLSEECNEMLLKCSLIDSSFDIQVLSLLFPSYSKERLLDLIEEAERHGFIRSDETGRRLEFSHALFRQTLSGELSISRRVRMHAEVGEALEQLYGDDSEQHAAVLSVHFLGAEALLGPSKAVSYSIAAGEAALDAYAFEEAHQHFRAANELIEKDDEELVIQVQFGLARVLTTSNKMADRADGWLRLVDAFDRASARGSTDLAVEIAMYPAIVGGLDDVPDLYKRALQLAAPESFEYGWIQARYGMAIADTGRVDEGREFIEHALRLAEKMGSKRLKARATAHLLQGWQRTGDHEEVVRLYREVAEIAGSIGDYGSISRIGSQAVISLATLGRVDEAKKLLRQVLPMRRNMGRPEWIASIIDDEASLARLTGDWETFRSASEELARYDFRGQANLAILDYLLEGRPMTSSTLIEAADKALAGGEGRVYWTLVGVAGVANDVGESELLRARRANEQIHRFHDTPENLLRITLGDAMIAIAEEDRGPAEGLLGRLETITGRAHTDLNVAGDRILARLSALTDGDVRTARFFENSLSFCRDAGYRPELVHTCADYSDWILKSALGDAERIERAKALIDEGIEHANSLGMKPLIERLERSKSELSSVAPRSNPDGLSDREVEVLTLLGQGRSNQEIADELFISRHTVVRHVANIYDKTGLSNRAEAAAYAHRKGLTPQA